MLYHAQPLHSAQQGPRAAGKHVQLTMDVLNVCACSASARLGKLLSINSLVLKQVCLPACGEGQALAPACACPKAYRIP